MRCLTEQLELVLASGCGANAPGGGGFQKGNTCGAKGKSKVYAPFEKHEYNALNKFIEMNTERAIEEVEGTFGSASDVLVKEWMDMGKEGQYQWAKDQGIIPSGDSQADLEAPGLSQEDYEAVKPKLEELVTRLDRVGYETYPSLEDFNNSGILQDEAVQEYMSDPAVYEAANEEAYGYAISELDPEDPLLDDKVDFDGVHFDSEMIMKDEWEAMSEEEQYQYAKDTNIVKPFFKDATVPDRYVMTSRRNTDQTNYENTKSVARAIQRERGREIAAERGITEEHLQEVEEKVWSEWKSSSTSRWGGALQAAVSDEFGSFQTEGLGPYEAKALIGDEQYDALKAHVRATWESSQYVMDKAGVKELPLYRALIIDQDKLANEPMEKVELSSNVGSKNFWKYPDVGLKRNGAQSTTIDAQVANDWQGVNATFDENKENRVVLQISARPEAVVSLPVHGKNVYGEQEVVLSGSDWNSWDAWEEEAPDKFWSEQEKHNG